MKKIAFLTFVVVFGNIFTFATPTEQEKNKLYVFPEKKEWKNLDTPGRTVGCLFRLSLFVGRTKGCQETI